MRPRKQGNVPCICRIDQPRNSTHGWYLRIMYRGPMEGYAEFFSDYKYGGSAQAFEAAIACRDHLLSQMGMEEVAA